MKKFRDTILFVSIISAILMALNSNLEAEESRRESSRSPRHYAVNLSLWYPVSINQTKHDSTNLNITLLYGQMGTVRGLDLAIGASALEDGLQGFQLTGLAGIGRKHVSGAQISGLSNICGEDLSGGQVAGLVNITGTSAEGFQIAGGLSIIGDSLQGFQSSGLFNIVGKGLQDFQATGGFNIVGENLTGFHLPRCGSGLHVHGQLNNLP